LTHRELAEADSGYFLGYYLGMWTLPHRRQMLDHLDSADQYLLLLLPRGFLKTSTVSGWITRQLAYNPALRVLCVSSTKELALENVGAIKAPFETNPKMLRDFGDLRDEPWGTEKFLLKRPPSPAKEPTCIARSVGATALGMHFDIIWCDDIITTETQWTEDMRKKVWAWFTGTLLRCLERDGHFIVTGTRKNIDDLYYQLLQSPGWHSYVYKAILDEPRREVLAPWLYTYDRLLQERQRMGSLMFAQEMQNEPVAAEGLALKKAWIHYYDLSKPPNFNWLYAGVDPAVGTSDVASYTGVVLIGVTPDHRFYILDMQRQRWPIDWEQQCNRILNSYVERGWVPNLVKVENVMTFKYVTAPLATVSRLPISFEDYKQKHQTGNLIQDKVARIQSLGVYFEQGRVFLPHPDQYPMTVTFEHDEYLQFPEGEFTDLLDALNLAILCHASQPSQEAAFKIG
jgi:phage terminase large subunit-like protein